MMMKKSRSQNVSPLLGREDKVYVGVISCSSFCCKNPFSMKESNFLKSFLLWVFTLSLIHVALCYCCTC